MIIHILLVIFAGFSNSLIADKGKNYIEFANHGATAGANQRVLSRERRGWKRSEWNYTDISTSSKVVFHLIRGENEDDIISRYLTISLIHQ